MQHDAAFFFLYSCKLQSALSVSIFNYNMIVIHCIIDLVSYAYFDIYEVLSPCIPIINICQLWFLIRNLLMDFGSLTAMPGDAPLIMLYWENHHADIRVKWIRQEKKEEIWLSPMTKAPKPTENPKSNVTTQNATKNFDYTTTANRLRTVSWGNDSHQLVWFNQFTGSQPSH